MRENCGDKEFRTNPGRMRTLEFVEAAACKKAEK